MKREVRSADSASDEPAKINSIQAITGIHLLTNRCTVMFKLKR
jgi:hypothetical protein